MNLQKTLISSLGNDWLGKIANMLGQNKAQSNNTLNTALGFIFGWLWKNATTTEGAKNIISAAEEHDTKLLPDMIKGLADGKIDLKDGAKILKHIFGDKTPAIEKTIADNANIPTNKVWNLLKTLAPLILTSIPSNKTPDNPFDIGTLSKMLLWSGKSANNNSSLAMSVIKSLLNNEQIQKK